MITWFLTGGGPSVRYSLWVRCHTPELRLVSVLVAMAAAVVVRPEEVRHER